MEEQKLSDFNEAAAQMQRLHNSWLQCDSYKEKGLIDKYEVKLRSIESELKYDAKQVLKNTDHYKRLMDLNVKIEKSNQLILKSLDTIYHDAAISRKWSLLTKKEELLREIEEDSGKGSKRSDPNSDEGM